MTDKLEIIDKLNEFSDKAAAIAVAAGTLGANPSAESGIEFFAMELSDALRELGSQIADEQASVEKCPA